MKNYKHILEAVNKGIKFALDDFEDQEDIQGQDNSKVKYKGGTKEWLNLNIIDLGLPSGTLWCKYNLGCDAELLEYNPEKTKPEDWYGDYYSWGELKPNKASYGEKDYKFTGKMLKYNKNDGLINLLPEDDASYQSKNIYNTNCHIPTKEQCEELIKYTTPSDYIENYNSIEGLNGIILTSNINNNKIFIPDAGYWNWRGFNEKRIILSCATRYEKNPHRCYVLQYYSRSIKFILNDALYRTDGFPIRPVINL